MILELIVFYLVAFVLFWVVCFVYLRRCGTRLHHFYETKEKTDLPWWSVVIGVPIAAMMLWVVRDMERKIEPLAEE